MPKSAAHAAIKMMLIMIINDCFKNMNNSFNHKDTYTCVSHRKKYFRSNLNPSNLETLNAWSYCFLQPFLRFGKYKQKWFLRTDRLLKNEIQIKVYDRCARATVR